MAKKPITPLALQASAILKQASLSCSGSTEDCGTERPQQLKGVSAWIWSPTHCMEIFPLGSMFISTVRAVTLSEGGHASMIPPETDDEEIVYH